MLRNKILALILGPTGVGLFAQLQTVQTFTSSVVPMGMQTGALKYLAQYRASKPELLPRYVATATRTFLVLSAITVAFCLIFVKQLAAFALDDPRSYLYLIPPLLGVPFLIQTQVWLTYLQAGLEVKAYSKALVLTSLVSLPVAVPIILIWGQTGAAFHLLIVAILGYFIARVYAVKATDDRMLSEMKNAKTDPRAIWDLVRFGSANLPVFALTLGIPFLVRTQIIRDLGLTANGFYQVVFAISAHYLMMPLIAIGTYILPKVSQLSEPDAINKEINGATKLALLLCTASILIVLLARHLIIELLYSRKFLPAATLLPWQMVGDFFRAVAYVVQTPLLPQERFRARNIYHIVQYAVFLAVFYLAPPQSRLQGAVFAYAVGWAIALVMTYFYTRWLNGFGFDRNNWYLFLLSTTAILTVASIQICVPRLHNIVYLVSVAWIAIAIKPNEWQKILRAFRKSLRAADKDSEPSGPTTYD